MFKDRCIQRDVEIKRTRSPLLRQALQDVETVRGAAEPGTFCCCSAPRLMHTTFLPYRSSRRRSTATASATSSTTERLIGELASIGRPCRPPSGPCPQVPDTASRRDNGRGRFVGRRRCLVAADRNLPPTLERAPPRSATAQWRRRDGSLY